MSLKQRLEDAQNRLYWFLRDRLAPGLENSQAVYVAKLRDLLCADRRWLDLGCGRHLCHSWMTRTQRALEVPRFAVGVDGDRAALADNTDLRLRVCADVHALPFGNATFDVITANMVLEHIAHPDVLLDEINRVLKPGGCFVVHTPNRRGYTTLLTRLIPQWLRASFAGLLHSRQSADVYPTFYRANTVTSLSHLAGACGLTLSDVEFVESSAQLSRIAPLLVLEFVVIRLLRRGSLARFRPCLLVTFQKHA